YHINQMINGGIIITHQIEHKTVYQLQEAYYDQKLMDDLTMAIIPFIKRINKKTKYTQISVSETQAIEKNVFMFMRLFQSEMESREHNSFPA
ncbi:MAG: hypothetical protein PHW73_13120, partial [Atribacterota bacterium]|nr:hypothetical protein [Atribacterota bacterium]